MIDPHVIYDKGARAALTGLCWSELNKAARKIPLAERGLKQRRLLTFGETGDVKYLDGLQDIIPLYDAIAEHDPIAATALETWVRVNARREERSRPPVERAAPTFQRGQKVRVATTHKHYDETGRVHRAEATDVGGLTREHVWVKFDPGACPVLFQDFQLEAV